MKISIDAPSPVQSVKNVKSDKKAKKKSRLKKFLNFKSAYSVSKELANKGIRTEFRNNDFFARCAKQTVDLFEGLFGRTYLPKYIEYNSLPYGVYGQYTPSLRQVEYNSDISDMRSMGGLRRLAMEGYNLLIPNDFSSTHPAHTHVHEFAHSAHHKHLDYRHSNDGERIMDKLRYTQVPTAIGRLITRFKLGNYALDTAGGMDEFMAEKVSKDVTGGITDDYWQKKRHIDVGYSDIFTRKWNYRYSSPQSYLDYFTQQVWNGDIDEAERAAGKVEEYLAELDGIRVPETVQAATEKSKGGIFSGIMSGISGIFGSATETLDRRNRLVLRY